MNSNVNALRAKRRLALSGSTAVLALLISAPAMAQEVESVVSSSSRIMSSGFDAPTPTTVINADELVNQANTNVFTTVTQLPSLMGSTGSSVGNGGSSNGVNGLSALNIRGIGTQRNLIMIDGERVIPTSTQGVVDISQFPSLLLQRVDVVTGGASASWGSDAVSGVVNFILDRKFEGFKMNVNGGISNYADDPHAQIQLALGTSFLGGRGHVQLSAEFTSEAGIDSVRNPRKWYKNPQQLQMFTTAQCQPNGCPANAAAGIPAGGPQWYNGLNGKFALFSYGGLITRGPLQGTQFGANGQPSQFDYGFGAGGLPATPARAAANAANPQGTAAINGCSTGGYCFGGDLAGNQTGFAALTARLVRGNTYARVSYDITPEIEIYASAIYSEVVTWGKPTQSFFKSDNLHIGCDNPFLPQSIAQACLANNGQTAAYNSQFTSITQPVGGISGLSSGLSAYAPQANIDKTTPNPMTLGALGPAGSPANDGFVNGFTAGSMTYGAQNSILSNVQNYNNRTMRRYVVGSDGVFNLFDIDWNFKAYFQHGEAGYHNRLTSILVTPYYNAAIDAVQVTANNQTAFPGVPVGSVICRSVAARSVGCQPLNIIGTGNASASSRSFVQGLNADGTNPGSTGRFPWQIVSQRQEVFDFGMSGDVMENWAGNISVATGFQYREEAFQTKTDCASRGNCANEEFGGVLYGPGGNPLLNASSQPGVLPPAQPNWYAGNFQPARGNFHEMEVFLETNIPLLDTPEWGRINFNMAGRFTHYTTSGDVSTWKIGGTWDTPLDGLRVRALQSRDVRAPNLAELYAGARVNNGSVTDRFALGGVPNQSISPLPNPITANPNLKPEKGQTTELGLVWSPSYVPGLNMSATYYRVGVKGIITQLSQQQNMDLCFAGNALQCSFIESNGVAWASNGVINTAATLTRPTLQTTSQVNIASWVTEGMDYEVAYRFQLDDVMDWGLGGDVGLRMLATNVMSFRQDPGFVGAAISQLAGNNSNGGVASPHWKIFFNQSYDTDTWGLFINERWFSEGQVNRLWVACTAACPAPVDANRPTVSSNYMPSELYFDIGGHYDLSEHSSLYFKIDNLTNQDPGNAYSFTPANQSPPINPALYDTIGRYYHIGFRINH